MKLVIAEKPMLGRDIARAICGKPVSETEQLPISGNGEWHPDIKEIKCTSLELKKATKEQYSKQKEFNKKQKAERETQKQNENVENSLSNVSKEALEAKKDLSDDSH